MTYLTIPAMMSGTMLSLVALLSVAGCATSANLPTNDVARGTVQNRPPEDARPVLIYSTADAGGRSYEILGQVVASADADSDPTATLEILGKEAIALGADAVVEMRLECDVGYWKPAIKATGTAVKLR